MLTPEGCLLLWRLATGASQDTVEHWQLVVSDGRQEFATPVQTSTVTEVDGAAQLVLTATIGQGDGNFDWSHHEVRSGEGVVVDRSEEDHGRKAAGAEWEKQVTLTLAGGQ